MARGAVLRLAVPLAAAFMAGCAEDSTPGGAPAPTDNGYNMIDPVESGLSSSEEQVAGSWAPARVDGRPALRFAWSATPQVWLFCDERDGLNIVLRGEVPLPPMEMMTLSTGDHSMRYAIRPLDDRARVLANVPAPDDMLRHLSAGRPIEIRYGDGERIAMPASPLVPNLIVGCRRT